MFFYLSWTLMCMLNFCNRCWMFLKSKPILQRRKIVTRMFLCRRSPNSILIVNKFNLLNFKYLMWVFGQALIINIPLLDIEIGCLQGGRQILFFPMKNSSPAYHRVFVAKIFKGNGSSFFHHSISTYTKKKTIDIVAFFCITLRMKLYNRFL
jgi:hypothetical protein